jgi:hypothetical protein
LIDICAESTLNTLFVSCTTSESNRKRELPNRRNALMEALRAVSSGVC